MNIRTKQVESILVKAIGKVVQYELNDPRVKGMLSVTHVDVSPDMANAKVMISVVPPEKAGMAIHALKQAANHIRRKVGDRVTLKRMPILHFELDEGLKALTQLYADIDAGMQRTKENEEKHDEALEDSEQGGEQPAEPNEEQGGQHVSDSDASDLEVNKEDNEPLS